MPLNDLHRGMLFPTTILQCCVLYDQQLNSSNAAVYCFQFIGPVSRRLSNQRQNAQGRYFPSMIQAMYLLIGIATISVTTTIEKGNSHIILNSWLGAGDWFG